MSQIHRIRRAILIPLALSLMAIFVLLLNAWLRSSLPGERAVLTAVFLLVGYLFLEVISRQAALGSEGMAISKLMRLKELAWDEITHLGSLAMGAKVYLLLTTTKGFYILSNNYERFPDLLRYLADNIKAERLGGEISSLLAKPPENSQPVRSAWLMAVVMMALMVLRLFI
jgi:hypothetical protein